MSIISFAVFHCFPSFKFSKALEETDITTYSNFWKLLRRLFGVSVGRGLYGYITCFLFGAFCQYFYVKWYGGVTGLHSFTYGLLNVPSQICYSLAPTSMSLRSCVFLYDTIGGCGKIMLSSGWFGIKYQFFKSISLTFGAAGLHLVTNGKILLRVLGFCCKAAFLLSKFISAKVLLI